MGIVNDLKGQTFNGILAIEMIGKDKHNKRIWKFRCHCGNYFNSVGSGISTGHTKSCGCSTRFHGDHGTVFYNRWVSMRKRCSHTEYPKYKHYGGRGITVCKRWQDYLTFKSDMFPTFKPELSLDRLDVNGNYEPGNCEWKTVTQQNRNKRNNTIINTPKGKMLIIEAAELFGIKETALHYRIKNLPYEQWFLPKYASWKLKAGGASKPPSTHSE